MEISVEAAFARIWRIDTIRYMTIALAALGFALFPAGSIESFFLEEEFGLDALERGMATSPTAFGLLFFLPFIGKRFDQTFKRDPNRALRILGSLLFPLAVTVPIQYFMPNVFLFVAMAVVNGTLLGASFSMIGPAVQTVLPYRLRGMGMAIILFFMFAIGAVGGGLLASVLQDEIGERSTIITITVIAMPLGAFYIMRGAGRMRRDLSLVVAGLISTIAIVLLSGQSGSVSGLGGLGPSTLARALVAAAIAGMTSFPRAMAAGIYLGVIEFTIQFNFLDQPGLFDFLLLIAVLGAVAMQRSQKLSAESFSFTPKIPPIPDHLRQIWWIRHLNRLGFGVGLLVLILLPLIVTQPSRNNDRLTDESSTFQLRLAEYPDESRDVLLALGLAKSVYIELALDTIDGEFGGIDAYARDRLFLTRAEIDALRKLLLHP